MRFLSPHHYRVQDLLPPAQLGPAVPPYFSLASAVKQNERLLLRDLPEIVPTEDNEQTMASAVPTTTCSGSSTCFLQGFWNLLTGLAAAVSPAPEREQASGTLPASLAPHPPEPATSVADPGSPASAGEAAATPEREQSESWTLNTAVHPDESSGGHADEHGASISSSRVGCVGRTSSGCSDDGRGRGATADLDRARSITPLRSSPASGHTSGVEYLYFY